MSNLCQLVEPRIVAILTNCARSTPCGQRCGQRSEIRSISGLPVDNCIAWRLLEQIPGSGVSWETHLMHVPRVFHNVVHRNLPIANCRLLTSPQAAREKLPLISEIRVRVYRAEAGRTISYPKARTIVLGRQSSLVYGV